MVSNSQREPRVLWSFWLACGLAATGGIAPLLLAAGGTNRISGVVTPFGIAAVAMAVDALIYQRGRPLATSLYFLAGIALVYGMLSMVAVPLRLAVVGTCAPAPAICQSGFERPFTSGESSGFAIGIAMGTLAILVGFFGLLMLYRIRSQPSPPPPTRRDAHVYAPAAAVAPPPVKAEPEAITAAPAAAKPEATPVAPATEPAASAPILPDKPVHRPRTRRTPKPKAELAPPPEPLELAPPAEPLELPETSSPDEPAEDKPSST